MTKYDYILPMAQKKRIYFLLFDDFELLDMSGPASVFSTADSFGDKAAFEIVAISLAGGAIMSNSAMAVMTLCCEDIIVSDQDSLFVVGAYQKPLRRAMRDKKLKKWLIENAEKPARLSSICSGAFILASCGLLNGHRATTHWAACQSLSSLYPDISVQADALYVEDGRIWTSAGVTTGIDMALAMIERDCGGDLMGKVAKLLVVYAHRPGSQSQFSSLLDAQMASNKGFSDLVIWIDDHLDRPLKVEHMAEKAGMSERSFYRKFTKSIGISPSRYLQRARLERASELLATGMAVKAVVTAVGFRSEAGFRTAFEGQFNLSPSLHQMIHKRNKAGSG